MFTCGLYQHVSNMLICRTQIRAQITPRPHSRSRCLFVMKMMKGKAMKAAKAMKVEKAMTAMKVATSPFSKAPSKRSSSLTMR